MYEAHFQLDQTPFSIAPDPAFLYLSDGHREALAHLTYGFSHGGFVLITGEVGTGKTTLLRNLIKQTPEDLDVAFVLNPRLTVRELLETLCDELGVSYPRGASLSVKQYIDALNRHLLATHQQGRGTVVIIDEAQNLSPAVLEQIRLLTNLETDKRKLLRIILIGQPELGDLLARNELRQLAQRVTARYHLGGLSREDTYAYVVHRLARAGGGAHLFSRGALRRLYRISRGIPRIINLVADRALLGAYAEGRHRVTARLVDQAAREVLGRRPRYGRWIAAGAGAALATGAAFAYFLLPQGGSAPDAGPSTPPAAEQPAPADATTPSAAADAATARPMPAEPATGTTTPEPEAGAPEDPGAESGEALTDAGAGPKLSEPAPAAAAPPPDTPTPAPVTRPDMPAFETQRLAYEAVLERWGADLSAWTNQTIPCNFAPSVGLQCLSRTGSWSDIRRLDLPVILELWDRSSTPYYGAVTGATGDTFTLTLGGRTHRVTPADLRDAWFGSYVVLWRMPPDYTGTLKRGDRHPSVRWLREQLGKLSDDLPGVDAAGLTGAADATDFDAALQEAVVTFQRQEQLLADGIVGPATWIRLGQRLDFELPTLE